METCNTLNRMATYDFKAPIDIVCFEETSDDEIDLTSSPKSKDVESEKAITVIDLNNTENETTQTFNTTLQQTEDEIKAKAKKRKSDTETKECENIKDTNSPKSPKSPKPVNTIDKASDSLKTISNYLTLILESLHHYEFAANTKNNTPVQISLAKNSYLTIKNHFFNAADEHVNIHILPNENNKAFISNFLRYTIFMANHRIKKDCSKDIPQIYFEMIKWVKERKLHNLSNTCKTPILMKHLNDPPIIPDVTISENTENVPLHCPRDANQEQFCIFSSGPPERQININVEKSLIINNNQVLGSNRSPKNKIIQQNLHTPRHFYDGTSPNRNFSVRNASNLENNYENHQLYGKFMRQPNNCMQTVVPANVNVPIADKRVSHYPPNRLTNTGTEYYQPNIFPNANYNFYHTTNHFQNNSYFSANNFMQNETALVPNTTVLEDGNLRSFRRDYQSRPVVRGPPPPYNSSPAVHPNQIIQPVTPAPTVLPGLPSELDLTRSSVSTDSGFVSPVISKSSKNSIEDIMNDIFELENRIEPPRAASAQEVCHVCQKKAKLMCSACYKTVYCNTKCQSMDWEVHRLYCSSATAKKSQ